MVSLRNLMTVTLAAPVCGAVVDLLAIEGKHSACPEGFHKVQHSNALNGDLNQGSGGAYIWLCVKEDLTSEPITDLTVVAESHPEDGCGELGNHWHRVRQDPGVNGDLNHGAKGKYIYLCYRKQGNKGPIMQLKLNDGDCDAGFFRANTAKDSNADLNQGAHGKYVYLCESRGCEATRVEGRWVVHGGQIAGETSETWTVGTHQSSSTTSTEDWKQSVSAKVSQGWEFMGQKGGAEITGSVAHETSISHSSAWSKDDSHTFTVHYSAEDRGKQPWQFQFSSSDSCGHIVQSSAQTLAITEGAFRPPCCVPGYAVDAPAYKVCHSRDTMVLGGEAFGCTVAQQQLNASDAVLV